ncbi:MAG: putative resolvase [Tepidanaerobacteraceae bacterium]|jgi:predicted site-specific integrase-resolvase|nr:putative resolvase [Tepidanaerobacteraceae bacterium]
MLLNIQKVKETYNISRSTLKNWEKEGLITPIRTPKGRRRYKNLKNTPIPKSGIMKAYMR